MIRGTRFIRWPYLVPSHALNSIPRRAFAQSSVLNASKPKLRSKTPTLQSSKNSSKSSRKDAQSDSTRLPSTSNKPKHVQELYPSASGALVYPEGLRVYSRSAKRVALLGVIRLMPTVFVGLWSLNVIATILDDPSPDGTNWPQVLQAALALLPVLVVVPLTSGYVARILVKLPEEAKRSPEALKRWTERIPDSTIVELKTVRANGFGTATTQCRLSDLRARQPSLFAQANFERFVDPRTDKKGTGGVGRRLYAWMTEPPRYFKINEKEGIHGEMVKEPWVWPAIVRKIEAQSAMKSMAKT